MITFFFLMARSKKITKKKNHRLHQNGYSSYFFLLGGKKKKITKRRTTGSRSEAKNRDIFSKRAQTHSAKAPFERDLVLNEKTYDFLNASPLNAGGHAARLPMRGVGLSDALTHAARLPIRCVSSL